MTDIRKLLIRVVHEARRDRATHPEGEFDQQGRWYPSDREDADGDGSRVRSPSKMWPYSYLLRCRTRFHCAVLVDRALAGLDVPGDVRRALERHLPHNRPSVAELVGLLHDTPEYVVFDRLQEASQ